MRVTKISILILVLALSLFAKKKGAPPMAAGAPGDRTCSNKKCHAGNELNSDKATIYIEGLPEVYTPNEIYEIAIHFEQVKAKKWGFQVTVADENGDALGTLMSVKGQKTQLLDNARYKSRTSRQYLTHTVKGISGSKKGQSPTWKFQWQAPDTALASSSFYFAFNAGNGNSKKTGDYIYTRSMEVKPTPK